MPIDVPANASPFARWLAAAIGDRPLNQVQQNAKVSASMLSRYVRDLSRPTPQTLRKLGRYFDRDPKELAELLPDPLVEAESRRGGRVDEHPPPWVLDMLAKMQEIADGVRSVVTGHAGPYPTASPARGEAARPMLQSVGHGGLIPVEVDSDDAAPRVQPGWICWLDPIAPVGSGSVVGVEVGGAIVLRLVDTDGRTLLSSVPGRAPLALDDEGVRLVGVGRLVQHEPLG